MNSSILNKILILFLFSIGIQSCTKTNYEYLLRPYNDIKQFYIVNSPGDTTRCLITGDTITVYWNPDVAMPEKITPHIVVDEKAKISPASIETVAFKKGTTYQVTAENGEVKTYHLNPVLQKPLPSVSSVPGSIVWLSTTQLNIYGENFLTNSDPSKIAVYMQRVSDGFEFPLDIISERTTNYSLVAKLPPLTEEQGIGTHRLYIKIGDIATKAVEIPVYAPHITNITATSSFVQQGQALHAGDIATINYKATDAEGGKIARFYSTSNVKTIFIYITYEETLEVTDFTVTENSITFKVPESINKYIGKKVDHLRLFYKSVPPDQETYSYYRHNIYFSAPSPILAK